MQLHLSDDQKVLQDSFARVFRQESTSSRIRAAEPLGFDPALWAALVAAGLPLMRVPEDAGGAGLTMFDTVLVAEAAGRHLASAPVAEVIVAARMLAQAATPAASDWLDAVAKDGRIVTLALAPAREGEKQLVPAGAVADGVLCLIEGALTLVELIAPRSAPTNLGSLPVALLDLTDESCGRHIVLARGQSALRIWQDAIDDWTLLKAAMMAAMARQALDDAAAYAKERIAFDRPIGSYQGLAHPMAESVTEVEGARLLVWRAASGACETTTAQATGMAYWWSVRAASSAAVKAMRVFGGYGMSMEYDAQLYFRRIRAYAMLPGDPEAALERLGETLFLPQQNCPRAFEASGISFGFGAAAQDYAQAARSFFREAMTPELERFAFTTDDGHHPFNQRLAQAGFAYPDWPAAHGGEGRTPYDLAALRGVYTEFGWPKVTATVTHMVGKILMHFSSEAARREILPRLARGEANCALGYSEPSCGSDIFAAKTRAVRDGEDWIIDGQKMWTSQGHFADYVLLIARTNPAVPKHQGLTLFIVPVDLPGYDVQEVKTLGGERTNITFYAGMRLPDRYRVGEVDGGVKVLGAALAMEQSGGDFFVGALQTLLKHAEAWARTPGAHGDRPIDKARVLARLAAARTRLDVADLLDRRCLWAFAEGVSQKYYGPMAKLFASEALVSCSTELAELAAPFSLLQGMTDLGAIELETRKAVQATIYGGTSEVQRSIIAESALGLPRTRS